MSSKDSKKADTAKIAELLGNMFSHNTSLKLFHWWITGRGSYAEHIAIDQALESLPDILDRLTETSMALYGDLKITVPKATRPENLVDHCQAFYDYVEDSREFFSENFSDSIIDDWQETKQQLLYRLRRLQ
ncbi:DUF5856 family protein [Oxalobacter vibrioformis]|uniref:DUF5856 family protein n=1 Tax=Oxalobacter vibrioformis TaxID=933080 RepID=A0A9E9LW71_9BURK|nr:DUF5856 family protein [Oxalobacter vibrioformis]NLC24294.1 hypothetical protein [Oxalobacter sp.]WAW09812.1 DUF5856 family protein [Oxalobacter vibrioformis]